MLSLTPAAITLYYLHFVVRKDMHETARKLKSKNSETMHDNSIRGRRNARRESDRGKQGPRMILFWTRFKSQTVNCNVKLQRWKKN